MLFFWGFRFLFCYMSVYCLFGLVASIFMIMWNISIDGSQTFRIVQKNKKTKIIRIICLTTIVMKMGCFSCVGFSVEKLTFSIWNDVAFIKYIFPWIFLFSSPLYRLVFLCRCLTIFTEVWLLQLVRSFLWYMCSFTINSDALAGFLVFMENKDRLRSKQQATAGRQRRYRKKLSQSNVTLSSE